MPSIVFLGCEPGKKYQSGTGATRAVVTLDLRELPEGYAGPGLNVRKSGDTALVLPSEMPLKSSILVLFHSSDAGTWRGLGTETQVPRVCRGPEGGFEDGEVVVPREKWRCPICGAVVHPWDWHKHLDARGGTEASPTGKVPLELIVWSASSSSGAGNVYGGIVRIPPEGILVVTSGYKGRGQWRVRTVLPNGEVLFHSLTEWKAIHGEGEDL